MQKQNILTDTKAQEIKSKIQQYKNKYGKRWDKYYEQDMGFTIDFDLEMKAINTAIHEKKVPNVMGSYQALIALNQKCQKRISELFGDRYNIYVLCADDDLDTDAVLIKDAVKTGKWKELPDDLQKEYWERADEK